MELLRRHNSDLESALGEKDAYFESLIHLGKILEDCVFEICIFDRNTLGFIHANRKVRENLSYSMSKLEGLPLLDVKKMLDLAGFDF